MTRFAKANYEEDYQPPDVPDEEWATLARDNPHQLFFVWMVNRPRMADAIREVEYTLYPPDTKSNELFELLVAKWPRPTPEEDLHMTWFVGIVPMADKEDVEKILYRYGFRLQDGVPHLIGGGKIQEFEIQGDNVFTVEFLQGCGEAWQVGDPIPEQPPEPPLEVKRERAQAMERIFREVFMKPEGP